MSDEDWKQNPCRGCPRKMRDKLIDALCAECSTKCVRWHAERGRDVPWGVVPPVAIDEWLAATR